MSTPALANDAYVKGFLAGIKPDERLRVSGWADKYRMLSSKAAAEPGPWRTSRTPYLREIMDCLSPDSPFEEIVFMKGAQIGGTEAGNNWLGYIMAHAPGPSMLVIPTTEMAKRTSKQRIAPMIEETPALRTRVQHNRARDGGNTLLVKEFTGGVLVITGANSAVGLRSMPVRNLMLDEIDAYPADVDGEGDPIELAIRRTSTYKRNRKIFKISTPLIKEISRIERDYQAGDQRRYHVPCPSCKHMQPLTWENITWPKDSEGNHLPDEAAFACRECGEISAEHHKTWMLENGEWVAEGESNGRIASFHISALYSPLGWYSWADAAREFLAAKDDQSLLQVWTNTVLGEAFAAGGKRPEANSLLLRRENYAAEVPQAALVLVAGVDVQEDRLEIKIDGYGRGEENWPVDKRILYGDTSQPDVWQQLDDALGESYKHESGAVITIAAACIDSGYRSEMVYAYVRERPYKRYWAIKGMSGQRPMVSAPTRKKSGNIKRKFDVFTLGVDVIKSLVYQRLGIGEAGPGYCHFPLQFASGDLCDEEYFEQLTAERCVTKYQRGFPVQVWEKTRPRNEVLDMHVYAYAALKLLNPAWDALEKRMQPAAQATEPKPAVKKSRKRGGFVSRYKH